MRPNDPDHITRLDDVTAADEPRAGGKAFNCARLKQAGFRVPDGIAILSSATDAEAAAAGGHPWFDSVAADSRFAVRSSGIGEDSAGQSFAGIHQTRLNVPRADLGAAAAACRASARSASALAYRRAKGLPTDVIDIAVLIQRMIAPAAAGVAFTINPVSGAQGELVINSSWGVGEALVSGRVDPDEFVIRKSDATLLWSRVGDKVEDARSSEPSLSPPQLRELAQILVRIEQHQGAPQDVEWCHDGSEFWIVQSRPITASAARTGEIEWTRANLAEVLPDVASPQALSALSDLLNQAERRYMGKALAPEHELGPMLKTFAGRLYCNLSQLRRACAIGGMSQEVLLKSLGHAEAIRPSDTAPPPVSVRDRLAALPDFVRLLWSHLRIAAVLRNHDRRTAESLHRLEAVDPRGQSDADLWNGIEEWSRHGVDFMQTVLLLGGVMTREIPVRRICDTVGFPFERLVFPQLAVGERSVSAQQAFDLHALADVARTELAAARFLAAGALDLARLRQTLSGTRFLAAFEQFIDTYGHRGRYESDWSLPRYREDPTPLLIAVRALAADQAGPGACEIAARQQREAADAWAAFSARLSPFQRLTAAPRVRRLIATIKRYYVWRERVRFDLVRILAAVRVRHLVLADRFVERGWLARRDDYFLLHLEEIGRVIGGALDPAALGPIAARRAAEAVDYRSIQMPLLMRESELPRLIRTAGVSRRSADEGPLTGHPVSSGCVEAEVVVVRDPADFRRMKRGAILVAPATDPSWTPLFTLASGVIVEVGGVLSHASTIAREYGLPALANVKHATRLLRTGERVRLDAVAGLIHRLDHAAARAEGE